MSVRRAGSAHESCGPAVALTVAVAMALSVMTAAQSARGGRLQPAQDQREAYADLPGIRLWYTDTGGTGVPVILLHSATGSSRVWDNQRTALSKRGFRVIAYDRRGFGRSTVESSAAQTAATGADDLLALADHLSLGRFHLVGTAAGGFVAIDAALSFPKRLRSLVVANSIGGIQDEAFLELNRRLRPDPFASLPADVRELGPSYRATNPAGVEQWKEFERTNRPAGTAPPTQPMRNRVTFAALETISVPTLLLTGDADLFAPPPLMKQFASRIPGAKLVVVPEAGHSTYWERPDVFNREVLEFLRDH